MRNSTPSELPYGRDRLTAAEWRQLHGLPPAGADLAQPRDEVAHNRKNTPPKCPGPENFPRAAPDHLRPKRGRMNKTEAAYAEHLYALQLGDRVESWRFESVTLRLADATRYTPDFLVELVDGALELHEVKGFWRDDARVKFKVAAELFPMFQFVAVKRKNRQWDLAYLGVSDAERAPSTSLRGDLAHATTET